MIKNKIHQEDITNINIYAPNAKEPKSIKQIPVELQKEINSSVITKVGDFNFPLSKID